MAHPSPVVAAIRPQQLSARPMPLPSQQVQAAAVIRTHTDYPVSTQHLAWWAVAAGLAAPHTVLGEQQTRAQCADNRSSVCRDSKGTWRLEKVGVGRVTSSSGAQSFARKGGRLGDHSAGSHPGKTGQEQSSREARRACVRPGCQLQAWDPSSWGCRLRVTWARGLGTEALGGCTGLGEDWEPGLGNPFGPSAPFFRALIGVCLSLARAQAGWHRWESQRRQT